MSAPLRMLPYQSHDSPGDSTYIRLPIIVVAVPRSGSSLLLALLSSHPNLWSLYQESREIFEGPFHPANRGWSSHALDAQDLSAETRNQLHEEFFSKVGNIDRFPLLRNLPLRGRGRFSSRIAAISRFAKRPPVRIVEKTVTNTLRIPFLTKLFNDGLFIHLVRDPRQNIKSMYQGWQHPHRHNDYPLPEDFWIKGYDGNHWSFVLPPGWEGFDGCSLAEICAFQWKACHEYCLRDLRKLPAERVLTVRYEDLLRSPVQVLSDIARWSDLDPRYFYRYRRGLPHINAGRPVELGEVNVDREIDAVMESVASVAIDLGYR